MPTTYTHYRFGRDVLAKLPRPLRSSIQNNKELYDIGLHGPDILFYYKALLPNVVSRQGYDLHDKPAELFFRNGEEVIKNAGNAAAARAYMYGFICHFALDSVCHPYVEKIIEISGIGHMEIEMELDRLLLVEDGIEPVGFLTTGHICGTRENAKVIAPYFQKLTVKEMQKSLEGMIICHKLLLATSDVKRNVIKGAMKLVGAYKSMYGMVMSKQPNPEGVEYCRLLRRLYEEAVPTAVELICQYQQVLFEHNELGERFSQTFGPGEHWEELII